MADTTAPSASSSTSSSTSSSASSPPRAAKASDQPCTSPRESGQPGTGTSSGAGTGNAADSPFSSIAEHGIVGNMRTVALVGEAAQIDYLCFPSFDSPTVFAALLDQERGGVFTISPNLKNCRVRQIYVPDTNVLLTRFMSEEGVVEITDFMPITSPAENDVNRLVRIVTTIRGRIAFSLRCAPRFDYGRSPHAVRQTLDGGVIFTPATDAQPEMRLSGSIPLQLDGTDGSAGIDATAEFVLEEKTSVTFVFGALAEHTHADGRTGNGRNGSEGADGAEDADALDDTAPADVLDHRPALHGTIAHWRTWSERSTYRGRYREMVNRSALLLKLLSSREHGAIIAAGTFGLPETTDGARRWDYRYVWIRDAAFSIYALLRLGHVEEADAFVEWMGRRTQDAAFDGQLKVVYAIDGSCPADEVALQTLADGHARQPPLVGNAAAEQLQLDIYGALMDAVYLNNKYGTATHYQGWKNITKMVDYVATHWREPDAGIWEFRDRQRELLHSRLMCWVTVDRALRLADKRSLPVPRERWSQVRNDIYNDIFDNFWNEDLQAFVQSKGSDRLDAAALMMPLVKFIAPKDPRWLSTLEAIGQHLVDDPLVYRYPADGGDGLDGSEGSFTACSFWYAEALARAGKVDEGRLVFEKTLSYANHLGLYSEEISAAGDPLGNFPQCLPHLALISAAYQLDRSLNRETTPWRA